MNPTENDEEKPPSKWLLRVRAIVDYIFPDESTIAAERLKTEAKPPTGWQLRVIKIVDYIFPPDNSTTAQHRFIQQLPIWFAALFH
jgi:hypothetical protein